MRIVFGWNSFKIRNFSLQELGISSKEEPGISVEVRQAYFHLFWIPFFSLGKRWTIRKGNQLYQMPEDVRVLVRASAPARAVRTPFYTYTWPLLLVIGLIGWQIHEGHEQYKSNQYFTKKFNREKAVLESKLQQLTTNVFISVRRLGNGWGDTTIYLKIEDINGDAITVTPVDMSGAKMEGYDARAWEVEEEYTHHANTLPSTKISYRQLQASYLKEYASSDEKEALKAQGVNLLNDGRSYVTTAIVRHFKPIVTARGTGSYGGTQLSIGLKSEGWPATISDIKELTGNGDWSGNINQQVPGRHFDLFGPAFTLHAVDCTYGKPYKLLLTLKDTTGHLYKYEIAGTNMDNTVNEL